MQTFRLNLQASAKQRHQPKLLNVVPLVPELVIDCSSMPSGKRNTCLTIWMLAKAGTQAESTSISNAEAST